MCRQFSQEPTSISSNIMKNTKYYFQVTVNYTARALFLPPPPYQCIHIIFSTFFSTNSVKSHFCIPWVHVRRVQGQTGTASQENIDKCVQRKFYCTVPSPKPNFYHNSNHCPCIYLSTDLDESLKFACFHCTQRSLFPTAAAPVLPRSCLTGIATLHMS